MCRTLMLLFTLLMFPKALHADVTCVGDHGSCTFNTDECIIECSCAADGTGTESSWSEGCNDGGDMETLASASPTQEECLQTLLDFCPEPPPDPDEACSTEELNFCEGYGDAVLRCEDGFEDTGSAHFLVSCCELYRQDADTMEAFNACLEETACDSIEEECFSIMDGGDFGDSLSEEDDSNLSEDASDEEEESADDGSSDDSGCSATGSASLLMLLGLAGVLRRKRG